MGSGVGGGDARRKIDRVQDYFLANPDASCRGAAPVLGVRLHDHGSSFNMGFPPFPFFALISFKFSLRLGLD